MIDTDTATLVREMMAERQRLLIREANCLRTIVGLPPVRGEDRVIATDALSDILRPGAVRRRRST